MSAEQTQFIYLAIPHQRKPYLVDAEWVAANPAIEADDDLFWAGDHDLRECHRFESVAEFRAFVEERKARSDYGRPLFRLSVRVEEAGR